ncbi:MAG: wbbL 2, partial [Acidobacteria bacterium]|nr:wbbL 2 [Acidobacteriota bacterium]
MKSPRVSFVIPVRNDAARLETCLRSILRNDYRSGDVEIIVVDNGSSDGSAEVATQLGARVIRVDQGRVAELRNRGAALASTEVLAFVDADNEIVAGWVYAALACLQLPGVGAAGALCHAPADGTWVQRAYSHLRGAPHGQHEADWLGSGNLVVWRRAFESVNGFDSSLETCEDVDFCHRLRARGLRLVSDARLKSVHHGDPATLRDVFSSERWRGRDNLRVSFRRPLSWASMPSAIVPLIDTVLIAAAIGGLFASLRAGWLGLLLASGALAAFAAASSLRVMNATRR